MLYVLPLHRRGPVRDGESDGGAAGLWRQRNVRLSSRHVRLDAPAFGPGLVGQSFTAGSWYAHLPLGGARRPLSTGRSDLLR